MKSTNRKTFLSLALGVALGVTTLSTAMADPIASMELEDFDNDGLKSDFRFASFDSSFPVGNSSNSFGPLGETGCTLSTTGDLCDPIDFTATEILPPTFTTGFDFGGTGLFTPSIQNAGNAGMARGEITLNPDGSPKLNFTELDFAGFYNGSTFFLSPESGLNEAKDTSGGPVVPSDPPFSVDSFRPIILNSLVNNNNGTFGVTFNFSSRIFSSSGDVVPATTAFDSFTSRWRVEGTLSVTDAEPTIFLIGGDVTVPVGGVYNEPGVSCLDVVEGDITASRLVTSFDPPSTDPNDVTSNFQVVYNCQDAAGFQAAEVRRDVTVGADTEEPVITLDACTTVPGTDCTQDGSSGSNTLRILSGSTYTDGGGVCFDNVDFDIPIGPSGPAPFFTSTPFPADSVNTTVAGTKTITFTCEDSAGNATSPVDRIVEVIDDNEKPVINLGTQSIDVKLTQGSSPPNLAEGITCTDTNPVDPGEIDITNAGGGLGLDYTPTSVDTSVEGVTDVVYSCTDAAGNFADEVTRTFEVVGGETYEIVSLTVSDIDGDRIAGCFKFDTFDPVTCVNAHRFSSDDSVDSGFSETANKTLPGKGTDKDDDGNPIGVRFGVYQDGNGALEGGEITPGFNFSGFPFVPITFNPNDVNATSPSNDVAKGFVTVTGPSSAVLTFDSLPWGGVYTTGAKNVFDLSPDNGTLTTEILSDNGDDDGITRTFNYIADWKHVILRSETSSLDSFNGFLANFRIEGTVTVGSTPVIVNKAPVINEITAAQGALANTAIVVDSDGLLTATVDVVDPDGDGLDYDWRGSDVPAVGSSKKQMFVFDPALVPLNSDAFVTLRVIVTDDADEPQSTSRKVVLRVTDTPPVLGQGDADGDGISDEDEGFGDSDNDLIPDYQDPITLGPTVGRRNFFDPDAGDVVSDSGRVRLGNTAHMTGAGIFIVTEDDIGEQDRLNRVDGIGHSGGGIYDFEVDMLDIGGTVRVVLPQAVPLPNTPVYRKYTVARGWFQFSTTGGNALASTKRVAGVCPGPDDAAYDDARGLKQGDDCVRLTILDGGAADGDSERNGVVLDPGSVSGDGAVPKKDGGGGGGCVSAPTTINPIKHADWWVILVAMISLGYYKRIVK